MSKIKTNMNIGVREYQWGNIQLSTRNYWRRLIAAHLAHGYRLSESWNEKEEVLELDLIRVATTIVDELERIEKEESEK